MAIYTEKIDFTTFAIPSGVKVNIVEYHEGLFLIEKADGQPFNDYENHILVESRHLQADGGIDEILRKAKLIKK